MARLVAGVDGWRGSWVAAYLDGDRPVRWAAGSFAELLEVDALVVAVDIPVGLPQRGRRRCDVSGRAALGPAAARLFLVPPRAALTAPDLAAANARLRAAAEPGVSAQMYALRHAVLEVEAVAEVDARVVEVHPELSFLTMSGRVLAPKRTARGAAERVAALAGAGVDAVAALRDAPAGVPVDDALDALAAAWTAERVRDGLERRYPPSPSGADEPVIRA